MPSSRRDYGRIPQNHPSIGPPLNALSQFVRSYVSYGYLTTTTSSAPLFGFNVERTIATVRGHKQRRAAMGFPNKYVVTRMYHSTVALNELTSYMYSNVNCEPRTLTELFSKAAEGPSRLSGNLDMYCVLCMIAYYYYYFRSAVHFPFLCMYISDSFPTIRPSTFDERRLPVLITKTILWGEGR